MTKSFSIEIDGGFYDHTRFVSDLSHIQDVEVMMDAVEAWIWKNDAELRDELDPNENTSRNETCYFEVAIRDDDGVREYRKIYVHPDEPFEANGDWVYRGSSNGLRFYSCDSIFDDDDNWWKIEDEDAFTLLETGGVSKITYTQESPFNEDEDEDDSEDGE